ncbi:hypothetical protein [Mycetocola sp.]|uniref:hypothetical protein n=1 Tax=Mycetocola sp. TaxID=1871042 RepID=UPI0039892F9D
MKYLKLNPHDLSRIDLKTFTYPRITYFKGLDRDGWDSMRNVLHVWMPVPYGERSINLYFKESHENCDEVTAEADLWNSDPKKYWADALIRATDDECSSIEAEIESRKKNLKRLKKMQKKLGKDS